MRVAFFLVGVLFLMGCDKKVQIPQNIPQKKYFVFVTYSSECPISQRYTLTLNAVFQSLPPDSFQWVFLKVNTDEPWDFQWSDSLHNSRIISGDSALKIAKNLDFKVFPEVAICQNDGRVLYKGCIDDRAVEVGQMKPKAQQRYFENAITQIREDKAITISEKKAVGCFIDYSKIH